MGRGLHRRLMVVTRRALGVATGLCVVVSVHAATASADVNLSVEFRQIKADAVVAAGGQSYSAGAGAEPEWEPQMLLVHSGAQANLQINDSIPMQWTQSVGSTTNNTGNNSAGNAGNMATNGSAVANAPQTNASAPGNGNAVSYALQWFDAGQSLTVTPTLLPGRGYALVKLEARHAGLGTGDANSGLPSQSRASAATTVRVPLAEWVTIASSGRFQEAHSYRSDAATGGRRLLQVRVMLP